MDKQPSRWRKSEDLNGDDDRVCRQSVLLGFVAPMWSQVDGAPHLNLSSGLVYPSIACTQLTTFSIGSFLCCAASVFFNNVFWVLWRKLSSIRFWKGEELLALVVEEWGGVWERGWRLWRGHGALPVVRLPCCLLFFQSRLAPARWNSRRIPIAD